MEQSKKSFEDCIIENYISINERKKIEEQKLVEQSDNKLTESLFSNNPYLIERSSSVNIVKIDKNKFVSVTNKKINPKNIIKPKNNETEKNIINEKKNKKKCELNDNGYDLNDYGYDYCDNFDLEDKYY